MAKDKKSFLLYCDLIHTVSKMPDDKAGQLLKHILEYVNDLNPETEDLILQLTFEPIKQSLKRDLIKYGDICKKNQENIQKRWNFKKNDTIGISGIPLDTKHTDSDSDSDSDSDRKKEYTTLLYYLNEKIGKRFRGDKISEGQFNARIKQGYSIEQFKQAIDNCFIDQYHKEIKYKHITPEFITRQDKLEKFLNSQLTTPSPIIKHGNNNW